MSINWRGRYTELTEYIANNPQIEVKQELLRIPKEYRGEFYQLIDVVRSAFVEEEYPEFLERAKPLCWGYLQAEREIMENYDVFEISISNPLRWFVNDPVDGVRRPLYDLLFDLLKERINIEQFRTLGRRFIRDLDNSQRAQCYQLWLLLSLTNLLKPNKFFDVNLDVGQSSVAVVSAANEGEYPVKEPKETQQISLLFSEYSIFIVPQIIVYSTRLNKFVALRAEPSQATWIATNRSKNNEWRPIDRDTVLVPGLITINISNSVDDLALIRDTEKIARPDLAIVCREPENWYEEEWLKGLGFDVSNEILDPRKGLHIVSRYEVPQEIGSKFEFQKVISQLSDIETLENKQSGEAKNNNNNMQILTTGLDASRLNSLVDILA